METYARNYVTCPQCDGEGYVDRMEKDLPGQLEHENEKTRTHKVHVKCSRCMGSGKVKGPSHAFA